MFSRLSHEIWTSTLPGYLHRRKSREDLHSLDGTKNNNMSQSLDYADIMEESTTETGRDHCITLLLALEKRSRLRSQPHESIRRVKKAHDLRTCCTTRPRIRKSVWSSLPVDAIVVTLYVGRLGPSLSRP
jgi:hypothetical protein